MAVRAKVPTARILGSAPFLLLPFVSGCCASASTIRRCCSAHAPFPPPDAELIRDHRPLPNCHTLLARPIRSQSLRGRTTRYNKPTVNDNRIEVRASKPNSVAVDTCMIVNSRTMSQHTYLLECRAGCHPLCCPDQQVRNAVFVPFMYKNDHFAKTGSGQT